MHDLDGVLKELGQFSRYQVAIYALLFLGLSLFSIDSMTFVFTTADIEYRCFIPECESIDSLKYDQPWLKYAIPFENGDLKHCLRYKPKLNSSNGNCFGENFSKETEECQKYVFGNNVYSITKDFDLFCEENDWKRSLVGTMDNVGLLAFTPLGGILSDRYGRKTYIVYSLIVTGILGTLRAFSTTYLQFIISETMAAVALSGVFNAVFILGAEIVGPDMRGLGGALINIYFSCGEILLGVVVWLFNDWRVYLKILYVTTFIVGVAFIWILPESIRWLISNGKNEKARKTIEEIARWNKKPLTNDIQDSINNICSDSPSKVTIETVPYQEENAKIPFKEVLKSKIIMLRLLNCSCCWFINAVVFFGLSVYSVNIGGDMYLNFILSSTVEIPGCIIFYFLVERGRKLTLSFGLIVSGIACLAFHFIPQASTMSLIIYFIGKMAITVSNTAICIMASELFPTDYRNTLFGFAATVSVFGNAVAPQVPLLAKYVDPLLVFSGLSLSAAGLGLLFPETINCPMPDSLKDAEDIGKRQDMAKEKY